MFDVGKEENQELRDFQFLWVHLISMRSKNNKVCQ